MANVTQLKPKMCYSIPKSITKIMLFLTDTYMRKIRNKIFFKKNVIPCSSSAHSGRDQITGISQGLKLGEESWRPAHKDKGTTPAAVRNKGALCHTKVCSASDSECMLLPPPGDSRIQPLGLVAYRVSFWPHKECVGETDLIFLCFICFSLVDVKT